MPINISALICDDIRQESNGKMFLIGAFVENMGVPSFPAENRFDCVIRFSGLPANAEFMELTIQHVGYASETTRFDFPNITDGCSTIVIFGFPFKAKRKGRFSLLVSVDGGRRRRVESLNIEDESSSIEAD
tara:strand:+ start:239 stop:631 length:393 start_codon:yes stop_codon:yes gene_type:complete